MGSLKSFALLIIVQILIAECAKIDPKLDFGDDAEFVQVKKEIRGGKIKGLRVTVDTSELKGAGRIFFPNQVQGLKIILCRIEKQWQ